MATTREEAEAIVAPLQAVADIRIRGMMGGWLIYSDDVLIGQVNEGELFLKPTTAAADLTEHLPRRPPYPGAKPAVLVPMEQLRDAEWSRAVVALSTDELRPKR
ncbi:MAG TPA: TfoX/Sxy family protein [Pseudolysinimonas sp.]|jgi:TfoX/Sxy family transcriptional regulator of competence genes